MNQERNAPCECGSGRKAKNCCGTGQTRKSSMIPMIILALVAGLIVVNLLSSEKEPDTSRRKPRPAATPVTANPDPPVTTEFTPAPQPPGPVPAGKVWSVEHGHWHDAPAVNVETNFATGSPSLTASVETTPPEDGEERNGLIWSAAHNHWHRKEGAAAPAAPPINRHDIPRVSVQGGTATQGYKPVPQPPGPVPPGKIWSPVHGHWHDAPVTSTDTATTDTSQPH